MGKNKGKQFNASKRCTLANMFMGKAKVAAIRAVVAEKLTLFGSVGKA